MARVFAPVINFADLADLARRSAGSGLPGLAPATDFFPMKSETGSRRPSGYCEALPNQKKYLPVNEKDVGRCWKAVFCIVSHLTSCGFPSGT